MAKEKVQITMDADLLAQVDDYCDRNYLNRSYMISQACIQVLNQQKIIDAITSISFAIQKVAASGSLDDDTKKEIESLELLLRMMKGGV